MASILWWLLCCSTRLGNSARTCYHIGSMGYSTICIDPVPLHSTTSTEGFYSNCCSSGIGWMSLGMYAMGMCCGSTRSPKKIHSGRMCSYRAGGNTPCRRDHTPRRNQQQTSSGTQTGIDSHIAH